MGMRRLLAIDPPKGAFFGHMRGELIDVKSSTPEFGLMVQGHDWACR